MNTEKINDSLNCGKWEVYVQKLIESYNRLDKSAQCTPAENGFYEIEWRRKLEAFKMLTTAQELSSKLQKACTESTNSFEGKKGLTYQYAENIEENLRQLCSTRVLKSILEKFKAQEACKQITSLQIIGERAESTQLEPTIDVTNLSDEERLCYTQIMTQAVDTVNMLETTHDCLLEIAKQMMSYRTDKPSDEVITTLFKDLAGNFDNIFAKAKFAYIKDEKPISFKRKDLTQEDNLHVLERLRDEHQNCAVENAKWGDKYRDYLIGDWKIMDLVKGLYHADGCEHFLTHLAIIDRCEKEIEELRKTIEEQKEQECQERESEDVGVVIEEQKEQERSESESEDISIDAEPSKSDIFDNKVKSIIEILQGDDWFKKGYRYAIIWMTLEQYHNKLFKDAPSFREYMKQLGIEIPVVDKSITNIKSRALGRHPNWTWKPNNGKKEDENEIRKRNDLASRFEHEFNVMTKKESKN